MNMENFFKNATNRANEFVNQIKFMREKKRVKVVKSVGVALMSLFILAGGTGCNKEIEDILNEGTGNAQVTTIDTSDITTTFNMPEETSRVPEETTAKPPVQTTPEETTTKPPVQTTPEETTTTPPVVTTPPEETTTPPEETTTPGDVVVTPGEDLPADEDGYAYPNYFANLVYTTVNQKKLFGTEEDEYKNAIRGQLPEIVFVERGESTKEEGNPIVIYSRYCIDEAKSDYIYTRMSFKVDSYDYGMLRFPQLYSSYAEYIAAVQAALQKKAELINADVSYLREDQDAINNRLGVNYAKFLGDEFIDATINAVIDDNDPNRAGRYVYGFVYDEEGKSYSYKWHYEYGKGIVAVDVIIDLVNQGKTKKEDFNLFEISYTPVAGVFQVPEITE